VKLKIRAFVKIIMLEKQNLTNFTYWLWFHLLKKMQLFGWHHVMANVIRKTCTKRYRNRPRFVRDMIKHFGVFFSSQF